MQFVPGAREQQALPMLNGSLQPFRELPRSAFPHPFYLNLHGALMFSFSNKAKIENALAQTAAIGKSQAVIEFKLDGTIVDANENFLNAMGYTLDEIKGKHHSMFVDPATRDSQDYRAFWADLNRGEFQAAQYKRIAKGGREIWIQASYNPMLDKGGKPVGVIKFATDITAQKIHSMEDAGKIAAIGRAQAVIEFGMDGTIVKANENFLGAMGYSLAEIQGKHHSMFVPPADRDSVAYRDFWARLNRGAFEAGEFKRLGKGGKEIWILATYNPILDDRGKPFKVVKFATDVTQQKVKTADNDGQIDAIGKSQAVIEFNMDGTIRTANPNFLAAMGYSLAEIQGKHHSMFVEPTEASAAGYREFWGALNRGEFQAAEYKRIAKGGREIWIQASYNPILDLNGKPLQGGEVRHRHHRAGDRPQEGRQRARPDRGGRRRQRGDERLDPRDLGNHDQVEAERRGRHRPGRGCRRASAEAQCRSAGDERHRRDDLEHHRADQPAGAQRHDRVGACGRSRARLRGGRLRGEEPRQSGQAGDRHDLLGNRRAELDRRRSGELAVRDQGGDRRRQRIHRLDRRRGRGAEHRDAGHVHQHAARLCRTRSVSHGAILEGWPARAGGRASFETRLPPVLKEYRTAVAPMSLRANGSRESAPDDRLREAIHLATREEWIASSLSLLAMTAEPVERLSG
ncbi:PAS domain S-box-containing protein [Bradyrhizobium sp. USDA 3256]